MAADSEVDGESVLRRRAITAVLAAGAALLGVAAAHAVDYRIYARSVGDAYQLVTSRSALLNRRRIHQYVGFGAYDLLSDGQGTLNAAALFRFDADFGVTQDELDDVGGLRRDHLSIQYAWVEARELGGILSARLGRQLHGDALDLLMVDGVVVRLRSPWHVGVELIAGQQVSERGAGVNASAFELDGVRAFEEVAERAAGTWALGAALTLEDLAWTRGRIGYRRLFSGGQVDQEKIGGSFYQRAFERLHLDALASWDLYGGRFDRLQAGARWQIDDAWEIEGEYVRLLPSFDADSIFNIFKAFALNDGNLRLRLYPSADERIHVGGMVRLFGDAGDAGGAPTGEVDAVVRAYGAMAGWLRRFGRDGRLHLDARWESGHGGERVLFDAGGVWAIVPGEWELDGRLTAVWFDDSLQPELNALSFGYQLGGRYLVGDQAGLSLMAEQSFSRLQPQNLRVLAVVDLELWL